MTDDAVPGGSRETPMPGDLPPFSGVLATDEQTCLEAADDFGHIVRNAPRAVFRPQSADDIARVIQYARRAGLKVAPRGQGNSVYGQSQVQGGILVEMSDIHTIEILDRERARVGAGAAWRAVWEAAMERGLTLPVLPDYLELSVGGTLSVGGVGRTTHRHGLLVDNVLELDVITGQGAVVTCSPERERALFEAVLGGLGQCAVIARATVRLMPAPLRARSLRLVYRDIEEMIRDMRALAIEERLDSILGNAVLESTGSFRFILELARYYTPPSAPDDAALLHGLSHERGSEVIVDRTFAEEITAPGDSLAGLKSTGLWDSPHPWFDVFLPYSIALEHIRMALPVLARSASVVFAVCTPALRSRVKMPMTCVPSSDDVVIVFDVARFGPQDPAGVDRMLEENRMFYEHSRALGGRIYPVGAVPLSVDDWEKHFSGVWEDLLAAKNRFDPDRVLSPGYCIFREPQVCAPVL